MLKLHARKAVAVVVDAHAHVLEELVVRHERHELLDRHRLGRVGRLGPPHLPGGAGRRLVHHHRVHRVVQVLDEHLPVAVVHVAQAAAGDLELALGRAVGHVVDRAQRVAEVVLEVGAGIVELDEDEAAVARARASPRPGRGPTSHSLHAGAVVALLQRDGQQRAVGACRSRRGTGSERTCRCCRSVR